MAAATPNESDTATNRHLILGTAGHIDHGKTALVRALTGTETDRLPEEQRRGMTIELGFADLCLGGMDFGIVDVPGHERFVRTMVAGATAIDLALLVVAADDSVMPQTVEHVDILSLLDVRHGVVAVSKCDLVDAELAELVAEEVRELLQETPLRRAPIVQVSSVTGEGLDELRQRLVETARQIPDRLANPPFRMAVDRVFTVSGRGTVVTGSVLRGCVSLGESLDVWPGGETCKIRDLQAHAQHFDALETGQRAALNLIGVGREVVGRGCELASPGYLRPTRMLDVKLWCLSSCRRPLKPSSRVRLCMGTRETLVRLVPLSGEAVAPGETVYAQLRAGESIVASHGQRFIVRDEVASRTIGGGVVLGCNARRWGRDREAVRASLDVLDRDDEVGRVAEVLRAGGFEPWTDLQVCAGAGVELDRLPAIYETLTERKLWVDLEGSGRRISVAALEDMMARAVRWLDRYHALNPDAPGCPTDRFLGWLDRKSAKGMGRRLLDRLVKGKQAKILGQNVCLPAFAPTMSAQDERVLAAVTEELRECGFQPPKLSALKATKQANLQRIQRLVKIAEATQQLARLSDELYLHPEHEQKLRATVRELTNGGAGFTVSQLRERINSSRKYVVPFVEYLDRVCVTRRDGDLRFLHDSQMETP